MDLLTGALVAAATGFGSIVAAVFLPGRFLPLRALRTAGGASLVTLGLLVLGLPLPAWLPVAVLVVGVAAAAVAVSMGRTMGAGARGPSSIRSRLDAERSTGIDRPLDEPGLQP